MLVLLFDDAHVIRKIKDVLLHGVVMRKVYTVEERGPSVVMFISASFAAPAVGTIVGGLSVLIHCGWNYVDWFSALLQVRHPGAGSSGSCCYSAASRLLLFSLSSRRRMRLSWSLRRCGNCCGYRYPVLTIFAVHR